jgi:hypothetical protein
MKDVLAKLQFKAGSSILDWVVYFQVFFGHFGRLFNLICATRNAQKFLSANQRFITSDLHAMLNMWVYLINNDFRLYSLRISKNIVSNHLPGN